MMTKMDTTSLRLLFLTGTLSTADQLGFKLITIRAGCDHQALNLKSDSFNL